MPLTLVVIVQSSSKMLYQSSNYIPAKQILRGLSFIQFQGYLNFDSLINEKQHLWCVCVYTQSCSTLCSPMDCSLPGSSVHGISQERILDQVAISSCRGFSWPQGSNLCLLYGRWILYYWAIRKFFKNLFIHLLV